MRSSLLFHVNVVMVCYGIRMNDDDNYNKGLTRHTTWAIQHRASDA